MWVRGVSIAMNPETEKADSKPRVAVRLLKEDRSFKFSISTIDEM